MKKNNLLRMLASLLIIMSLVFNLVACGSNDSDDDKEDKKTEVSSSKDDKKGPNGLWKDKVNELDKDEEESSSKNDLDDNSSVIELVPMTNENITLTYSFWDDIEISMALEKEFEAMYPNIDVVLTEFSENTNDAELLALASVGKLPDCFWISGSAETFIENWLLLDMSLLWDADPEARKLIRGIDEYKLGYYGTEFKWTTPVKFYPTAAFINLDAFIRNDKEMPSTDWTWEEFECVVQDMFALAETDGEYVFGLTSGAVNVISWYPLAADKMCIGEFGWNGSELDMENWGYGLNLQAEWINKEITSTEFEDGVNPQDIGKSAIHIDDWSTWEDYWITDACILDNKVVFVPYCMPKEESVNDGTNLAAMDFGGISPYTSWPREAYELLKFMTWGTEGWNAKLKHYPDLLETSMDESRAVSKDNMPITLDSDVWAQFKEWHPNMNSYDDYVISLYGEMYDRSEYFEKFFDYVQSSLWTCYGEHQILGFDTWMDEVYNDINGTQEYGYDAGLGIEAAVIYGGINAEDYYMYLQEMGNQIIRETEMELENTY